MTLIEIAKLSREIADILAVDADSGERSFVAKSIFTLIIERATLSEKLTAK